MANFTPGPWIRCFHLESKTNDDSCPCGFRGHIWGGDQERVVCEIGTTPMTGEEAGSEPPRYDRETELANAALIAAAPELYAALKGCLARLDDTYDDYFSDAVDEANAAIKKAEGR